MKQRVGTTPTAELEKDLSMYRLQPRRAELRVSGAIWDRFEWGMKGGSWNLCHRLCAVLQLLLRMTLHKSHRWQKSDHFAAGRRPPGDLTPLVNCEVTPFRDKNKNQHHESMYYR